MRALSLNSRWKVSALAATILITVSLFTLRTKAVEELSGNASRSVDLAPNPMVLRPPINTSLTTIADDDKGFWLTIRPTGFAVKEMTISAGDYFVVVQNATGLDRFSLRVELDSGQRIYDLRFPKYQKYWKQMVHLAAGHYVISEPDHPGWVCRISVN